MDIRKTAVAIRMAVLLLVLSVCFVSGTACQTMEQTSPNWGNAAFKYPENLTIGDPYTPELGNKGYDAIHYTIHIAVDPKKVFLAADVTIDAIFTMDGLTQISLDFVGFTIDKVFIDASETGFRHQGGKLFIALPTASKSAGNFTLRVVYQGRPVQEKSAYVPFVPNLGFQFINDNAYVVSEPDGARYWFPCNDHPRDKATFTFDIAVPAGYVGIANGTLTKTETAVATEFDPKPESDQYVWHEAKPMATYLATVAVGKYEKLEALSPNGLKIRCYVFADRKAEISNAMKDLGEAIDWMSAQFGAYPFEEFGYVTIHGLHASLETQTMVLLGEKNDFETMIHEMSHQWFGDSVSLDSWGGIWRSEGFATYIGAWYTFGKDRDGLDRVMKKIADSNNDSPFTLLNPPHNSMFGKYVYVEGAVVLHMLRKKIGEDAFSAGMKEYCRLYGGSVASDKEFQKVMERKSGLNLDSFFQQWLK